MKRSFREKLIAVVTFLGGIYFFLEFALPAKVAGWEFGKYHDQISDGFVVVGTMTIGLGLINLFMVHGLAILKTRKGWPYSAALLLGLAIMMFFEIVSFVSSQQGVYEWSEIAQLTAYEQRIRQEQDVTPIEPRIEAALQRLDEIAAKSADPDELLYVADEAERSTFVEEIGAVKEAFLAIGLFTTVGAENLSRLAQGYETVYDISLGSPEFVAAPVSVARKHAKEIVDQKIDNSVYKKGASFLYNAFFVPLGAAMFSLLAFYVASAAYRTFRIRSIEAGVMMAAALVVMLGQIPHGPLYISPNLVPIRLWLLEQLSTPAFRAIFFGSAIAGLAMAVRMWLSLERTPLDSED